MEFEELHIKEHFWVKNDGRIPCSSWMLGKEEKNTCEIECIEISNTNANTLKGAFFL